MRRILALFLLFSCFGAFAQSTVTTTVAANPSVAVQALSGTVGADQGGTGVANNVAATLTRSGNHALTLTTTGTTSLTLPTTGTVTASVACTWTPVDASAAALTFTGVVSTCDRNGNMVFVRAQLTYPATGSGVDALIGGFPVTVPNSAAARGTCVVTTSAATARSFLFVANTTTGNFYAAPAGSALANSALTGAVVWISCSYPAT